MNKHLIVYARKPEAHKSKTRLGASIGYQQAAGVYARLLFSYLEELVRSAGIQDVDITLSVADEESRAFFMAAYPELRVVIQIEGGLGERMKNSFDEVFALGAECAVLTGSDIPMLDSERVAGAFEKLIEKDVVFGPAEDGGYFLVGMNHPGYDVFEGISWSKDDVLKSTLKRTHDLELTSELLPMTFDLDVEIDYQRWVEIIRNS